MVNLRIFLKMAKKTFNTAQSLLAHVSLKVQPISLFGGEVLLKQWTASQRLQYIPYLLKETDDENELAVIRPQANLVILSMVNKQGKPLFPFLWNSEESCPEFESPNDVDSIIEARSIEFVEAFKALAHLNGIVLKTDAVSDDELEDASVKN